MYNRQLNLVLEQAVLWIARLGGKRDGFPGGSFVARLEPFDRHCPQVVNCQRTLFSLISPSKPCCMTYG
jgi:hypothetical protein